MVQNKMEADEDNKAEETDADVAKRDLIQVKKGELAKEKEDSFMMQAKLCDLVILWAKIDLCTLYWSTPL